MRDLLLVGGGLSNGLLASRLAALRPDVDFLLLEAGPTLGGNHTWSFHGTDVSDTAHPWLGALGARRFEGGHDVLMPGLHRTLAGSYHTIASVDFDRSLREVLRDRVRLNACAVEVTATHVVLETGERLEAGAVIDARARPLDVPCAFQKFLGQEVRLQRPHGLQRPLLMDATVEQVDGFRFVYALPFGERHLLVEDTLYSNTPQLDLAAARGRIADWLKQRGLTALEVLREESAALPLPLRGPAPVLTRPIAGVSAGFFHATTGYSLPYAVELAEHVAALPQLDAQTLTVALNGAAQAHWRSQRFFRLLNRMLFLGAKPEERVKVFASFYQHDEALIARFYAGRLTFGDTLRALAKGAPTVPGLDAMKAAAAW